MASYHSNYLDYFRGDVTLYTLKQVIASEGGSQAHLDLFLFLITPSFKEFNKRDMRCPLSVLFQFPVYTRLCLTWLLHQEELRLQEEYNLNGSLLLPIQIMLLHSNVLGEYLSPLYIEASGRLPNRFYELLGYTPPNLSGELFHDVGAIMQSLYHPESDINLMYSILESGNRVSTGNYIAQALGYKHGSLISIQDALNRLYV